MFTFSFDECDFMGCILLELLVWLYGVCVVLAVLSATKWGLFNFIWAECIYMVCVLLAVIFRLYAVCTVSCVECEYIVCEF